MQSDESGPEEKRVYSPILSNIETHRFLIDKDADWTSFDVVNKIRKALRERKVGHAGTLDPLATGLVLVCTGKATKEIEGLMGADKEYTGTFVFGATTPSYDAESLPDAHFPIDHLSLDLIREKAQSFLGPQMQIPPLYSAIKKDGKKLYELARRGKTVELEARPVEIKELEIFSLEGAVASFRTVVSKGTYIRSLAHDLGKACESGAYLGSLRRTRIGDFRIEDALTIPQFLEWWAEEKKRRELEQVQTDPGGPPSDPNP
jgi:tRNA pseudouridine55 synthase